jgi:hypothetical protein
VKILTTLFRFIFEDEFSRALRFIDACNAGPNGQSNMEGKFSKTSATLPTEAHQPNEQEQR